MERYMAEACDFIRQNIEDKAARYAAIADRIWEYAELGLQEHRSAGLLTEEGERFSETPLIRDVAPCRPTKGFIGGGSDIGDVTYVTPTAHFLIATCAMGTPYHSWRMTAQSGSGIAHKGMLFGAEAMALAGVRMLRDPALLEEAREELLRKTGGKQVSLLQADQRPVLS